MKQIVSMETLKDLLHQHERVKLDDPQDRGDLYLLAPMRLLTPILEEEDCYSSMMDGDNNPEAAGATANNGFNRSVMTVISELLTNHSKSMQAYQSMQLSSAAASAADTTRAASQMSQSTCSGGLHPDGRFPDSVESACSTLVSTIEEISSGLKVLRSFL